MNKPIRGKVAKILSSKELVINLGAVHGVYKGMCFNIVETTEIKDPDSSSILGKVERPKILIQTIDVQEKLSVASTLGKSIILKDVGSYASALLPSTSVPVKVGDVVIQDDRI